MGASELELINISVTDKTLPVIYVDLTRGDKVLQYNSRVEKICSVPLEGDAIMAFKICGLCLFHFFIPSKSDIVDLFKLASKMTLNVVLKNDNITM